MEGMVGRKEFYPNVVSGFVQEALMSLSEQDQGSCRQEPAYVLWHTARVLCCVDSVKGYGMPHTSPVAAVPGSERRYCFPSCITAPRLSSRWRACQTAFVPDFESSPSALANSAGV